jgi:multisubunit Na+/H+ antiporter MnhE subunit
VRHALAWLILFWLWLLLVGEWNRDQWIAAAVAATVATAIGSVARRHASVDVPLPAAWMRKAWTLPVMVVVDFAILMWALVRRKRGVWVRRPLPGDVSHPALRAWLSVAATYSPNAYVVAIDADDGVVLLHDLVRNRSSESPV